MKIGFRLLLILTVLIIIMSAGECMAQVTPEPSPDEPKVCISQDTANKCGEAMRLKPVLEQKVEALEAGRKTDADIIKDLQIKLAQEVQKGIDADAERNRLMMIIEFLLKHGRTKKYGIINF
jgi:hypothetical protein